MHHTLAQMDGQACAVNAFEDSVHMSHMVSPPRAKYLDIIKVWVSELVSAFKHLAHQPHDCGCSILYAKWPHYKLIQAKWSGEC